MISEYALPVNQYFTVHVASENSLIYYAEQSSKLEAFYRQLTLLFANECFNHWQVSLVPAFKSLLISFNALVTDHVEISQVIKNDSAANTQHTESAAKEVTLPIFYDETLAPDLLRVAKLCRLTTDQVIKIHVSTQYKVQAIGFAPGFGYLGELNPKLTLPRLTTPRLRVPKGAVAIANNQTAVYPDVSPGGWHIIGFCPLALFDRQAQQPLLYNVGDTVTFKAISQQEFVNQGGDLTALREFSQGEKSRPSKLND